MRVAVCVSGAFNTGNPNGDLVKNNTIQKANFPDADFYYATWQSFRPEFEKLFPNKKCIYFPEHKVQYHPYEIAKEHHLSDFYQQTANWAKKGGTERMRWTSHHTKQILIHSWLMDTIENEYDVIVRTRFDGFISKNAKFAPYLEDTFKNNRANCFGATHQEKFDQLREIKSNPNSKEGSWSVRLLDQLIIYNANALDGKVVNTLDREHLLLAAEYGWYQVISLPRGSNHRNFSGWVNHDKRVLDKFLL